MGLMLQWIPLYLRIMKVNLVMKWMPSWQIFSRYCGTYYTVCLNFCAVSFFSTFILYLYSVVWYHMCTWPCLLFFLKDSAKCVTVYLDILTDILCCQ